MTDQLESAHRIQVEIGEKMAENMEEMEKLKELNTSYKGKLKTVLLKVKELQSGNADEVQKKLDALKTQSLMILTKCKQQLSDVKTKNVALMAEKERLDTELSKSEMLS